MIELTAIQKIAIWLIPVIFAVTLHEAAHGWLASKFGDQTARLAGRVTINPMKHIDIVGTVIVPMMMLLVSNFIFGWAKPVPIDSRNMRNPVRDMAFVALAGPVSNLLMAVFWACIARLGVSVNAWFGIPLIYMGQAGMMINVVLGVLNCLPIPPLDGSRVLSAMMSKQMAWKFSKLEPYGIIILVLLMISGILSFIIAPIIYFILNNLYAWFGLTG